MENKKNPKELNDEVLDTVSGGLSEAAPIIVDGGDGNYYAHQCVVCNRVVWVTHQNQSDYHWYGDKFVCSDSCDRAFHEPGSPYRG